MLSKLIPNFCYGLILKHLQNRKQGYPMEKQWLQHSRTVPMRKLHKSYHHIALTTSVHQILKSLTISGYLMLFVLFPHSRQ